MPVWNRAKKEEYFERVEEMLGSYTKVLVVGVSPVGWGYGYVHMCLSIDWLIDCSWWMGWLIDLSRRMHT